MNKKSPASISQPADTKPVQKSIQKPLPKRPISATPIPTVKSDLAPTSSIRPKERPEPDRPKARPSLKNLGKYSSYLYDEATRQGIEGVELIALLAQAAHETKKFTDLSEDGKPEYFNMYDPEFAPSKAAELGNDQPGDGEKYKGRGFLHITGKYNYNEVGQALGMSFVKNPELLEDPVIAAKTSVWYWINRVRPHVSDFSNVKAVTRPINKKLNKLAEREAYFAEYTKLASKFGEK
jgi:putative chitinase